MKRQIVQHSIRLIARDIKNGGREFACYPEDLNPSFKTKLFRYSHWLTKELTYLLTSLFLLILCLCINLSYRRLLKMKYISLNRFSPYFCYHRLLDGIKMITVQ